MKNAEGTEACMRCLCCPALGPSSVCATTTTPLSPPEASVLSPTAQPNTARSLRPSADKNNKREHRGFGFVTFETEAAIQRVVAHGPHHIRGSIVAIDSAVPRQV